MIKDLTVDPVYLLLAYTGMLLYILMKLSELSKSPDFTAKSFFKNNIYSLIATVIMIPLILIMAKTDLVKDTLPINNVTAVLAGWQTNSVYKSIMGVFGERK